MEKGDAHELHQSIRVTPQRTWQSRENHSKLLRRYNGISHILKNKNDIAQKAGVKITDDDFLVNMLPKNLTSDWGELVGEVGDRIASQLGVNVETTASYRGDMKGIVEKAFDLTEKDLLGIIPNYNHTTQYNDVSYSGPIGPLLCCKTDSLK